MAFNDSFTCASNATLLRNYQILSNGAPQSIVGWTLHCQWRNADGSLALDFTLKNGLFVLIDAPSGQFAKFVQPDVLRTIPPGSLTYDILAKPPTGAGLAPQVLMPFNGTVTLTTGCTIGAGS